MTTRRSSASKRRSPFGRLLRLAAGLAGVIVVAGIAAFLVATAGVFAPIRTAAVETILSGALGAPVDIEEPVEIRYGPIMSVSGRKIRIERPEGAPSGEADTIEAATIGFSVRSLLAGRFDLTSLKLKGVSLADNSRIVGFDPDAAISSDRRWFGIVPGMVRIAKRADIAISDAHYRYRNPKSGWEFDITVADVATDGDASSDSTTLTMSGTVNGQPVKIEGDIHPLVANGIDIGDGFTLTATGPGGTVSMRSIVPSDTSKTLRKVVINANATSIGEMLDTLKIARSVDGTATMSASIDASGTVSSASDLKANVSLQDGFSFQVSGSIANLEEQKGFDLAIDATFPPASDEDAQKEGLLAFEIYDISAHLSGDLGGLAMDDGWITTNLFSDALPQLGPITAGDIRRDEKGRLAVDDIEVLAGPADQRTFDLKGRIGDLLELSDFRLAGDVSIPTAQVIGFTETKDDALGRLTGQFAVSDATGEAGIDTFTAKLTGSSLLSAAINLTANQTGPEEQTSFDLTLDVPDYAKLATVLGVTAEPVGAIRYKGGLTLSPHAGTLEGHLGFGKMEVSGTLAVKEDKGRPLVTGKISTPLLTLADARRMFAVGESLRALRTEVASKQAPTRPETRPARPQARSLHPRFDISVSAAKVEGAGEAASSVSGRVLVDDGTVTAESFELKFEGGQFGFNGQMNVREESRPFSAKGNISNWSLDKVFKQLELDLPITGVLHAAFDLSSSGTTVDVALRKAKGDLNTRIENGVIGNRLLDLTGLVLPSWLTSKSAKTGTSQVDCFTASIRFDPGLATVRTATIETDEVIVTAAGKIDFANDTIDIQAQPKALSPNLIPIVSPFAIEGGFANPKVVVKGGVAGRAVAETLALPLNTLGTLLGIDKTGPTPEEIVKGCK